MISAPEIKVVTSKSVFNSIVFDSNYSAVKCTVYGGGCSQVVRVLAFYSHDLASNPTEAFKFYGVEEEQ